MKAEDVKTALLKVCDKILDSEEKLTIADSYIGDGDHGVGMTRGFKEAKLRLQSTFSEDLVKKRWRFWGHLRNSVQNNC